MPARVPGCGPAGGAACGMRGGHPEGGDHDKAGIRECGPAACPRPCRPPCSTRPVPGFGAAVSRLCLLPLRKGAVQLEARGGGVQQSRSTRPRASPSPSAAPHLRRPPVLLADPAALLDGLWSRALPVGHLCWGRAPNQCTHRPHPVPGQGPRDQAGANRPPPWGSSQRAGLTSLGGAIRVLHPGDLGPPRRILQRWAAGVRGCGGLCTHCPTT